MSHYYPRWCETHGEWDQDVDRPYEECPDCTKLGIAPSQLETKRVKQLEDDLATATALLRGMCDGMNFMPDRVAEFLHRPAVQQEDRHGKG